jgi:hypothetical protein
MLLYGGTPSQPVISLERPGLICKMCGYWRTMCMLWQKTRVSYRVSSTLRDRTLQMLPRQEKQCYFMPLGTWGFKSSYDGAVRFVENIDNSVTGAYKIHREDSPTPLLR